MLNLIPDGTYDELTTKLLTKLAVGLAGGLLFLLGLFFTLMEKKYRQTSLSVETGGQISRRRFLEGNDLQKASVFGVHDSHLNPIKDKI